MTPPIVIRRCQLEIDLENKDLPTLQCWRDRERTVNPKLLEGMTCDVEGKVFERDGKEIHRWETICRPAERVYRRFWMKPSPKVLKELQEELKRQKPHSKSAAPTNSEPPCPPPAGSHPPAPSPKSQPKPKARISFPDKDVISP